MSLDVLAAVSLGYRDRIWDQELLAVQSGYWSGYWSNSKKPKSLGQIIGMVLRSRKKSKQENADTIDVESFLAMEQRFNERRDSLAR